MLFRVDETRVFAIYTPMQKYIKGRHALRKEVSLWDCLCCWYVKTTCQGSPRLHTCSCRWWYDVYSACLWCVCCFCHLADILLLISLMVAILKGRQYSQRVATKKITAGVGFCKTDHKGKLSFYQNCCFFTTRQKVIFVEVRDND